MGHNKFEDVQGSVIVLDQPGQIYPEVARVLVDLVKKNNQAGKGTVLGLPTGATPVGIYREVLRLQREESVSFEKVTTFNLDEYYPLQPNAVQSYHRYMWEHLFSDLIASPTSYFKRENVHIPDGTLPADRVEEWCDSYEKAIRDAGGIDLILLGIGRSGHIGFNEPGSEITSRTRLVLLDQRTRKDAAADFFSEEHVPRQAITMGISTILSARHVIMIATGENKSSIVKRLIENRQIQDFGECPACYLRRHPNCDFYFDRAAAQNLAREKTPWLVHPQINWDFALTKRAVVHLAQITKKSLLQLQREDFYSNGLTHLLLVHNDQVDQLIMRVWRDILSKIMIPKCIQQDDFIEVDPTIIDIKNERVLVFSPHPDDDVICMSAMLHKLIMVARRHGTIGNIKVSYMTNGSVSVSDTQITNMLRFQRLGKDLFDSLQSDQFELDSQQIFEYLGKKNPGDPDPSSIQKLKDSVRRVEAISALEALDLCVPDVVNQNYQDTSAYCFLDLPFYRTGQVKKNPISKADIEIVLKLLNTFKPHHIFVAGDLTDPHGTHRMCYSAIKEALKSYDDTLRGIWLYRGAWQEWNVEDVDLFVPMSKLDMERKINAIFKHQSQKDKALFPGNDSREFWERARDRNQATAMLLGDLGLPRFHAVEAFVRVSAMP